MKTPLLTALTLGIVLSFSSCGSKLNDEQKGIFFSTMAEVNKTKNSIATVASDVSNEPLTKSMIAGNQRIESLEKKLDKKFNMNDCNVTSDAQKNKFTVSGSNCPITITADGNFDSIPNNQSGSFSVNTSFAINDSELKELSEVVVTGMSMNIGMTIKIDHANSSGSVKGTVTGHIDSKKVGLVKIEGSVDMEMNQNGGDGSIKFNFIFPDFTAELEINRDGATLNGEDLSKEEFKNLGIQ